TSVPSRSKTSAGIAGRSYGTGPGSNGYVGCRPCRNGWSGCRPAADPFAHVNAFGDAANTLSAMTVEELAPGLWRWTGYHEEWKQDVGCLSVETSDGLVLIDPLVPPEDSERFLTALDRDVARLGGAVHVLITVYYHARSAGELIQRHGGRLWAS